MLTMADYFVTRPETPEDMGILWNGGWSYPGKKGFYRLSAFYVDCLLTTIPIRLFFYKIV